ncbi:MAG: glycoside hydrolase family 127 protein [Clostridia bacterium]|nr:glycoside hydrolase family 127 protein [Clostridia bacterium]
MDNISFYTSKEISPSGWLRRQLEIQAKGLSGNLHKIWPDIRDSAWIGGDREGWERVPYWLDGFIPLAYLLGDEELIRAAKKYIDAIISSQEEDGWICPCEKDKRKEYDTWAIQLICKALKVYYDCSGDERIPEVIYKVLKNYYDSLKSGGISLFRWGKYRWFETFISLNFLYEKYEEEWIKELAQIIKKQGFDYNTAVKDWMKPSHIWRLKTHVVNIAMMLKSEAVSHSLLGEKYTDNAERLLAVLECYNGTAFRGFTGDEVLSGLDPTRGTELCAVVELMYSYEEIYKHTGDNKWLERLEMLAFNALPATLSEDMWTHQYVQQVNQIACRKTMIMAPWSTNGPYAHTFGLEPNFGCCTANFSQGWPKFTLSAFARKGDTVISTLMLPSVLTEKDITVRLETDYPFNNKLHYYIDCKKDMSFIVRIPSFAQRLQVNGEYRETGDIEFSLTAGQTELKIEFSVSPCFEERPNGLSVLKAGSLLFSVPVEYEKIMREYTKKGVERKFPYCDYQLQPTSPWNYAFSGEELKLTYHGSGEIPFSQKNPPVTIKADMKKINWGLKFPYRSVARKIPKSLEPVGKSEKIDLCPYGCARLRMTEMPVLGKKGLK